MTDAHPEMPPVKLAFIIDNVVQDILHTDDRLAAIFLSEPTIVDVTNPDGGEPLANVFDSYNPATGEFTTPKPIAPAEPPTESPAEATE